MKKAIQVQNLDSLMWVLSNFDGGKTFRCTSELRENAQIHVVATNFINRNNEARRPHVHESCGTL
jgi:hypothetical protein